MAYIQAYLTASLGPLQKLLVDYSLLSDPVLLVLPRIFWVLQELVSYYRSTHDSWEYTPKKVEIMKVTKIAMNIY